jgi:uncharacterized OB-fold protein
MGQTSQKWPGVELSNDDLMNKKVTQTRYHPKAKYSWTAGEAISRFLNELKEGRLIGRECKHCDKILFPPRMFCEQCFKPTSRWVYVKDTGTIQTYSISYLDKDAKRITEPIYVGVVSIDGASEKMGIMHYFGEVTKDTIHIGMKVKAKWKPQLERTGSILDIEYFRPLKEGEQ